MIFHSYKRNYKNFSRGLIIAVILVSLIFSFQSAYAAAGLYAGNEGTNPTFTVSADYFWDLDDTDPDCIPFSDVFFPEVTPKIGWTFVDPSSDSTLTMTGTNAEISVAAGTAHEFWAGLHNAPHLVQAIPDTDFGVEVKFESVPSLQYQEQGIVVKEDSDTMLRIETFSDGASIHLFAAYIDGTVASIKLDQVVSPRPPYLRLARTGDSWTYSYSNDGSSWTTATTFTQEMTANWVGFY